MRTVTHHFLPILALVLLLVTPIIKAEDFENYEEIFSDEKPTENKIVSEQAVPKTEELKIETEEKIIDSYDNEEFIGIAPPAAPRKNTVKEAAQPKVAPQATSSEGFLVYGSRDWSVEAGFGLLFLIYTINYIIGSKRNHTIIQQWKSNFISLYAENFQFVGHGEKKVVEEAPNRYTLITTGRINCRGSHTELVLEKRHDLFSIAWNFLYPTTDSILFTVPLLADIQPIVFAVVPESSLPAFIKSHPDVAILASKKEVRNLDKKFKCVTDSYELTTTFLSDHILKVINENVDLLEYIYVSDHNTEYENNNIIQISFKIPSDISRLNKLTKLCFHFIDTVATTELSKAGFASAKKNRASAVAKLKKEENLKKLENLKEQKDKEKKEKIAKMTPEELEKYNDKVQKRKTRKLQNKQSKKVVAFS